MRVRRGWVVAVAVVLAPLLILVGVLRIGRARAHREEYVVPAKPEAPPDLEKLRPAFAAGLDAIQRRGGGAGGGPTSFFSFWESAGGGGWVDFLPHTFQL